MELKRVVVTGLGALTPIGNSVPLYWQNLLGGVSGVGEITHFDSSLFKTHFACELKDFNIFDYIDNKEAKRMDPCAHYALVATLEAMADSGLDLEKVDKERVGVIIGSGIGGFMSSHESISEYTANDKTPRFSPFLIPKVLADLIPGIISMRYGFRGPNYATTSACASAANAIVDACHFIQLGKADIIVSGGSEACIIDAAMGGFNAMHALSTRNDDPQTASRPFDVGRDGFVMGEGAGTLILEEYEHAKARGAKIYAEIAGIGLSADAYHITAPHPDGHGAFRSMKIAIEDAHLQPTDIDHINTHGTSTPAGDVSECKAIENLFGEHALKMVFNSTKSMTGHLLGGAAAIESIATLLAMQNSLVPPTINQFERDPNINKNWNLAANRPVEKAVNAAICNSFGFGGHNVSLLFKKI